MSTLATLLPKLGLMQSDLARGAGVSKSTISALVAHGQWPKRRGALVRDSVIKLLCKHGAKPGQIARLPKIEEDATKPHPQNKLTPASGKPAEVDPSVSLLTPTRKEEDMLLPYEAISAKALEHFGIKRSPFVDEVQSSADVYQTSSVREARAALLDAGLNHSFVGLVAESGAGKSTLVEDLEERIDAERRNLMVIRPFTLAMSRNDNLGKTLKSTQIGESISRALDPQYRAGGSTEGRFDRMHELLIDSRRAGMRHLLVIEEAHDMPIPTLKHLKRFLELKDRMKKLIGVALIAQPELLLTVNSANKEVREVMQRCEIVKLRPLDGDLEGYLRHKFRHTDVKLDALFAPDAMDAIRARLWYQERNTKQAISVCHPLVVNNLVCRAMNACAKAGWDKVDAKVIAAC